MTAQAGPEARNTAPLWLVLALVILLGIYWALRFSGYAMEGDATTVTNSAEGMLAWGKLIYPGNYHAGYAYTSALAFVSALTGLSLQSVQLGSTLWLVAVGLVAYITYREILGGSKLAVLAVFLLFTQPDFLFYVLRASHEKATWLYGLLMVFLTVRSYRYAERPWQQLIYILLFYLSFYALATTNTLFASSFAAALMMSFAGGWVLNQLNKNRADTVQQKHHSRLFITAMTSLVIVFAVMTYIYPPSSNFYFVTFNIAQQTSALLLGAQPADPYLYVESAWLNSWVYLALTGFQWIINVAAFIYWGTRLRRLDTSSQGRWLLWLMYTAFGAQLAASIVVDYSGVLSANLQVRQFTPFALFSSPMAALAVASVWGRLSTVRGGSAWRSVLRPAAVILAMLVTVAALFKVTNDPLLGNQWMFYTPGERQAIAWIDKTISGQRVWTDTNKHLTEVLSFWEGFDWQPHNTYDNGYSYFYTDAPYVIVSRLTHLRTDRLGNILLFNTGQNKIYDNGDAAIYHRRALTPYQR